MTDKKIRRIVPVHCAQPISRPVPPEKELEDDIWNFSPIRIGRSSSPPSSEPRRSRYHTRELSHHNCASHGEENIPASPPAPPSTQPRRRAHSSDDDSDRVAKKRRIATGSKANCVNESSSKPQTRPNSHSTRDKAAKNRSSSSCNKEIPGVGHIVDSINKMAAEAREDRQEVNNTLKKLLDELQRRL